MKRVWFVGFLLLTLLSSNLFAEDNEVFVLGLRQENVVYYQTNSKLDPMNVKGKKSGIFVHFIAGPVKNGSSFVCSRDYSLGSGLFDLKAVLFSHEEPVLQAERNRLEIKPNERGICLFYVDNKDVYSDTPENQKKMKSTGISKKAFQKLLKAAIKEYEGTEWEAPLTAELEEWK